MKINGVDFALRSKSLMFREMNLRDYRRHAEKRLLLYFILFARYFISIIFFTLSL